MLTRRGFTGSLAGAAAAFAAGRGASAQTPVTIRAAITPVYYDAVPILYAQRTGMFAKAGIDLQLGRLPTGAAITAAVVGGSLDVGKSTFPSVVAARARGIPIAVIAPGAIYDSRFPNEGLVVAKDSPIHGAADLVGKVVSVNNLDAPDRPAIERWLEQNGVDRTAIKLVEIPMSAMPAALDAHRIDGIILTSPILDETLATGKYRSLAPVYSAIAPRWLFSSYSAMSDWANKNPETVKRFADVIVASAAYTNAHHGRMTALVADLIGAPETSVAQMTWPAAGTALKAAEMQPVIDISAKYGMIASSFDAHELIFDPRRART